MKPIKMNKTKALDKKAEAELFDDTVTRPHALNIEYFMAHPKEAIRLQLSNMIATYGEQAVADIFVEKLNTNKKVA